MLNKIKPKTDKNGYTLIEIMVVISIMTIIVYIASDFLIAGYKANVFNYEQDTAIQNARRATEIISKELRGANNSAQGDYPISVFEEDDLVFYSDIDDDQEFEKVRYFLDNNTIYKVVTNPGPAFDYNMPSATTTVAQYIHNQEDPLFSYYDGNYNETDRVNEIRLIGIQVTVNVTPSRMPNDYTVITEVNLRNLKDNL